MAKDMGRNERILGVGDPPQYPPPPPP